MALTPGVDVELDGAGAVTAGSGLKLELYTARVVGALITVPALDSEDPPYGSEELPVQQSTIDALEAVNQARRLEEVRRANADAAALLAHVAANAELSVDVAIDELATDVPTAPVTLGGTLS